MSGQEKLARGLSIQTIVTIAQGIMEITYFSIMSRLLSKTDFGYFATITAVVTIFYSISEAGLGSAIIQKKEDSNSHIDTAFSLSIIFGVFCSILLFVLAPYISSIISESGITWALRIMSGILLINSLNSIANGILSRKLHFKRIGILQISAYTLSIVIAVIMAVKNAGVYALVANAILYPLLLCIGYYSLAVKIPKFSINKEHAKSIIKFGGWLTCGVIVNNISHQIDKLLMPRLISIQALGAYNRPAGFISTITSKINSIFDTVLFPLLSKYQDDKDSVKKVFERAIDLLNPFSVLLASAFIFNASLVINIFFGNQWMDLIGVTQIIAISSVFNINGRLVDCFFRSINLVKLAFIIRTAQLFITIIGVYIGCRFNIYGLAVSIVVINLIVIFLKVFLLCRNIKESFFIILCRLSRSWVLMVPFAISYYIIYRLFDYTDVTSNIIYAIIFCLIACIEFIVFPKFVGEEYTKTAYPYIIKLLRKFSYKS